MTENETALASQRMGTEAPGKLILYFTIPSILTMVISSMYNVVDKIFVGNSVGYLGLTATTASTSVMMLITACYSLIGSGASIYAAMALGEEDRQKASKIIGSAIVLEIIAGALIAITGTLLLDPISKLTGAGPDALPYVRSYLGIIFIGTIGSSLGSGLIPVIRAVGKPRAALIIAVCGSLTNCVLDPIFIFVFNMGISGAALATILAQLLTAFLVLGFFLSGKSELSIAKSDYRLSGEMTAETLRLGVPGFVMTVIMAVMVVIFTNTLKYYGDLGKIGGDTAISSLGLSTSIGDLVNMLSIGMQQGIAPLVAFNYSAQKYDRVRRIFYLGFFSLLIVLVLFWGILELFPQALISLFGQASDLAFAIYTVRVYNLALPMMAFQIMGSMYLQSTGKVRQATLVGLTRNVLFGIPLLLILPLFFGVYGAMAMGPIADAGGAVVSALLAFRSLHELKKLS